jgi:hypothetical protein
VVREDLTGIFIRRADGSRILHGTDAEALEFSRRVKKHFSQMALRMVQARSIGPIDFAVPDNGCAREGPVRSASTLRLDSNLRY